MLLGFLLLWVGAVLFLNGLWLMGKIEDREIAIIDIVGGLVASAVAVQSAFGTAANAASIRAGALIMLFATTYFWVAYNRWTLVDGRGLGWFSLFVAITLMPVTARAYLTASTGADIWMATNWLIWVALWLAYFLLLALGKPILKQTAWATLLAGIATGWLPGFLMLDGLM